MTKPLNSQAAKDIAYVLHPNTNLDTHLEVGPQIAVKGRGIYIYDDEGKEYIEGLAGLWYASLGFSEQRLIDAAKRQMDLLPCYHSFAGKSVNPMIDLAEILIKKAPVPMSKVFFTNSGSEANDTAIKIIWYVQNALGRPLKKKIISRQRAYHGITVVTGSLTGLAPNHGGFDLPVQGIIHTDCPHHWRHAEPGESEEAFASRLAANLEQMIEREGPDTIGAFFAEPVLGAGGVIPPPATYFDKIQPILKKHDILFVADEVICGFGRTGNMWGCQTYGLKPDIITMAKQISSGYLPIAGVMVNERVFEAMRQQSRERGSFGHGFTYSGHPTPAAVALETQRIYEERNTFGYVKGLAPYFQRKLRAFADHPLVGEARGVGLIGAIELTSHKPTKATFKPMGKVAAYLNGRCYEQGLILRNLPVSDAIGFCPPLIITEAEIDLMMDRFAKALEETTAWVKKENLLAA